MEKKIRDLKLRIDKLVPENVCKSFINLYEDNKELAGEERSYKYQTKTIEMDNFGCLNLSKNSEKFLQPLNVAKKYIGIMITNYVFYIQNTVCPTFDKNLIADSINIRILKYEEGQYIKDHADVTRNIRASCTLNLNEDYEGGEFRFFNGQIKESFKTGDAMLFPAEPIWIHGTEPITKGTRYCINCFLEDFWR